MSLSVLEPFLKDRAARVTRALETFLPTQGQHPAVLHEAMRYAVLTNGKRIRPVLALAVYEALGGQGEEILVPACAIELIHSYSLIHDDLPCLDNDEYRRGQLTCHKKFGEAIALLAGDGLQTLGFNLLSRIQDPTKARRISHELTQAAGVGGMVGGQVMDILAEGREIDVPTLDAIHIHKTGKLIQASCVIGAVMADASHEVEAHIWKFGEYLGFAFQIVDDIIDGDGYLRFMSAHEAKVKAEAVTQKAKHELNTIQNREHLMALADFALHRK